MEPRIIFMGSPDFAVPVLEQLAGNFKVLAVVTQPDRPSGRGRMIIAPPVKQKAGQLGISVIQPQRLRDPEVYEKLVKLETNLIVVAAYGQILRQDILNLPRFGCINVHASLLPRWRGAAPIQAAILAGDEKTGVTIMKMDAGIDTGAILSQKETPIFSSDTGGSLTNRLANLGAELLLKTLDEYLAGSIQPRGQDDNQMTLAPMLQKKHGELIFSKTAVELERQVRAYEPWPGSFFIWQGNLVKVHKAKVDLSSRLKSGEHGIGDGFPVIGTAEDGLILVEVQPSGKKTMTGSEFLHGARNWVYS